MFPRHVCTLQADSWRVCSQSIPFGMWSGQVHELWERHHSDWAHDCQLSPCTNISHITTRRNSTTSIPLAPCTMHSYWSICPVHQSSEQYDKYSLDSLYNAQLLFYLSSVLVVGTVRQVFPWPHVQSTVTGIFVQYTSRRNSTTNIPLTSCTIQSYWSICPVNQS